MKVHLPKIVVYVLVIAVMLLGSQQALAHPGFAATAPIGTAFTYQGHLRQDGDLLTGTCDLQFSLYDADTVGTLIAGPLTQTGVTVNGGQFTVSLDFGASAFDGNARWLELGVRCPAGSGTYATLTPRQALTGTPFAAYAGSSPWDGLIGIPAGFADGVDNDTNTTYSAGSGLALNGTEFSVTGAPWGGLTGVPAGFADGVDNNTTYSAGAGLTLTDTMFSVDETWMETTTLNVIENNSEWFTSLLSTTIYANTDNWFTTVLSQTFEEGDWFTTIISNTIINNTQIFSNTFQLAVSGSCPAGSSISTINPDGTVVCETDDNTTYSAGTGLSLTDTTFDVTGAPWSGLTGIPAGFADGTDDNTTYSAGTGLSLTGTTFDVTGAPWSGLTGVPAGFADGTDDNTTYTAGAGLALNGTEFSAAGSSYQNMVVVAKSGGDFTTIQAALNSITDASSSNRYLVWVAPGVYNEQVTMKSDVDVRGASMETVVIQYGATSNLSGVVITAPSSVLSDLTISVSGTGQYGRGVYGASQITLRNVKVEISGTFSSSVYGIFNSATGTPKVDIRDTQVYINASVSTATYGVYLVGGTLAADLYDLDISVSSNASTNNGIYLVNLSGTNRVEINTTTLYVLGSNAAGGAVNGIETSGVAPVTYLNDVVIYATSTSGSSTISGMLVRGGFEVHGSDITAYGSPASGSAIAYGINLQGGTGEVYNSTINAEVTSGTARGVFAFSGGPSYPVYVVDSSILGSTNTLYTASPYTFRVAGTMLSGGAASVSGGGFQVCAGVYDESYTFYTATCP